MQYTVRFIWTGDDKIWYAKCDNLKITLESGSFDELALRMRLAVRDVVVNEHKFKGDVDLDYVIERKDTVTV